MHIVILLDFMVLKMETQKASESLAQNIRAFEWLETHDHFDCLLFLFSLSFLLE